MQTYFTRCSYEIALLLSVSQLTKARGGSGPHSFSAVESSFHLANAFTAVSAA